MIIRCFRTLHIFKLNFLRWNNGKGETIDSNSYYWSDNEPNIKEFDYETRKICPITTKAFEACSSNPKSDCSISTNFKCDNRENGYIGYAGASSVNPSPRFEYSYWLC